MEKGLKVGLIGATGYAGAELFRLLAGHPEVGCVAASSASFLGKTMRSVYPNLGASGDVVLGTPEETIASSDVVFSALPHGHAEAFARVCLDSGKTFVDLSADFRFGEDADTYKAWYSHEYQDMELHGLSVYGLPELNRKAIAGARIVGNPGCYPTCSELALFPLLALGLVSAEGIVIDAKSGVTGAGREPTQAAHYPDCADSVTPYKVGGHRHVPEIESVLSVMAGKRASVTFVPHLVPMNRGIVCACYARLRGEASEAEIIAKCRDFYSGEPFVRVASDGGTATNRNVRNSNFCDVSYHVPRGGDTVVAIGAIDNMVKGAAGQAVQNMNVALGIAEAAGLGNLPAAF